MELKKSCPYAGIIPLEHICEFFWNFWITGFLGITLRVLRNTGFSESSLMFIYNYLHFFAAKTIYIYNPNSKHKKS